MRRKLKLSADALVNEITLALGWVVLVSVLMVGCLGSGTPPPNLTPRGQLITTLDEAALGVATIQRVAVSLNTTATCTPPSATTAPVCHPILSDPNTRIVVDAITDLLMTLRSVPAGAKATILQVLDQIDARLDATGREKLKVYTSGARTLALGLIGAN